LINVESGAEKEVTANLRTIKNVKDVYFVFGVFDFVVKVQGDSVKELKDTITWRIRRLDRIVSTQTMMIMD
jgi:DNA-binding Lrp family transcriptional regulator